MGTRRQLLILWLAFLITLPAVTTRIYASDEIEYFSWLRSIAFDGDADFQNEYQHFYDAIVSGTSSGSVVAKTKRTCAGGSSSVFKRAFQAKSVSWCASSMM